MAQRVWRSCFFFALLVLVATLAGCSLGSQGSSRTPTATSHAKTATAAPGGAPTATPTPATACSGQAPAVPLPAEVEQVGKTTTRGAATSCAYRVALDLQTAASFFRNQMVASGWSLLKEQPEGAQSVGQEYFQGQSFATIILDQHGNDPQTTDIYITVETST